MKFKKQSVCEEQFDLVMIVFMFKTSLKVSFANLNIQMNEERLNKGMIFA